MINKFQKYYQENNLFTETDNVLLTVSGGKDSMVMLTFFINKKLSFGVAHCNFQLRGEAAIEDQKFIELFCKEKDIPFYTIDFETQEYATKNGISIQMAARDLRYSWFEKIRIENGYNFIATAHHKNDVAETMLINLTKGTGLAGLHGIRNKNQTVIRPLLCFTRKEIDEFAHKNSISFNEDLSNANTKYTRNSIRHNVISELKKINPAIIETLNIEANQFLGDEKIIEDKIKIDRERLFTPIDNGFSIDIDALKKLSPLTSYLFYLLRDYNFNSADVSDIVEGLDNQSGKTYSSSTHQIIKDRECLLLNKLEKESASNNLINSIDDLPFFYEVIENITDLKIDKSNKYAYLDLDKIQFPIILRNWKQGDYFKPLGMKGNKKVSDFLIDNKFSLLDKKSVQVLVQNSEIIWLVGNRIDDRFKITSETKKALILSI
jgi:tRNA(Ile)-lysidine synthase